MATLGLRGIWGLEQLDRTGLSTRGVSLVLLGALALVALGSFAIRGQVDPESPVAGYFSPEVMFTQLVLVCFIGFFNIFVTMVLARTTEADVQQLRALDPALQDVTQTLRPAGGLLVFLCLAMTVGMLVVGPLDYMAKSGVTFLAAAKVYANAGMAPFALHYVVPFLLGPALGAFTTVVVSQFRVLQRIARDIRVDLVWLAEFSAIANPLIRVVSLMLVSLSVMPVVAMATGDKDFIENILSIVALSLIIGLPILVAYFLPVLRLRNRISAERLTQLTLVRRALSGDAAAIAAIGGDATGRQARANLMMQQLFLESRWEWPIAGHVQKLILFGILPPTTWVLAALVEHSLF